MVSILDEEHDKFAQKIRKAESEGDLKTFDLAIITLSEDIKNLHASVEENQRKQYQTPNYSGDAS